MTGSEHFLADFEKMTISYFFCNFQKITKIVKNHSKVTFLTRMAIENMIFGSKPARMIPSKSIFDLRGPIFCKIHDFLAKSCFFCVFLVPPSPPHGEFFAARLLCKAPSRIYRTLTHYPARSRFTADKDATADSPHAMGTH